LHLSQLQQQKTPNTACSRLYDGLTLHPIWSPDGTKIAFVKGFSGKNAEIYVMNADGSDPENLTHNPSGDDSPVWSPDGTKIGFVSIRDGDMEIYVMNADGSSQMNLRCSNLGYDFEPAWAP